MTQFQDLMFRNTEIQQWPSSKTTQEFFKSKLQHIVNDKIKWQTTVETVVRSKADWGTIRGCPEQVQTCKQQHASSQTEEDANAVEEAIGNYGTKVLSKSLQVILVLLQPTWRPTSFKKAVPRVLDLVGFCTSKTYVSTAAPQARFFLSYLMPGLALLQQLLWLKFLLLKSLHSNMELIGGMCQHILRHLVEDTVLHLTFPGNTMILWSPEKRRVITLSPLCMSGLPLNKALLLPKNPFNTQPAMNLWLQQAHLIEVPWPTTILLRSFLYSRLGLHY